MKIFQITSALRMYQIGDIDSFRMYSENLTLSELLYLAKLMYIRLHINNPIQSILTCHAQQ